MIFFVLFFLQKNHTSQKIKPLANHPNIPVQVYIPNNIIQQPGAGSNNINLAVAIDYFKNNILPFFNFKNTLILTLLIIYLHLYCHYTELYQETINNALYCIMEYDESDNYKNIFLNSENTHLPDHVKEIAVLCHKTKQLLSKKIFFILLPHILFGNFSYKSIKKNHEKLKKLLLFVFITKN